MPFAGVGGTSVRDSQYLIDNSLRLNQSDNPRLTRTPSIPGNARTFTFSCWAKKSSNGTRQVLFGADIPTQANASYIRFTDDDTLQAYFDYGNNTLEANLNSVAKFRDSSAFYHVVWATDTTLSTEQDRIKIYVNGLQITDFQNPDYISQNFGTDINQTYPHYVGTDTVGVANDFSLNGYLAEVHFIDGQQLDASSFGEFDADSGIWKPKQYSGSYGTNGFYLDFENSGSLGADQSGNGNDFTPNNFTATDQTTDTPTNNFCTLNRVATPQNGNLLTFSEGNLKVECPSSDRPTLSTFGMSSGKWYFEAYVIGGSNDHWIGVWKNGEALNGYGAISQTTSASSGLACVYQGNTGGVGYNGSTQYTGSSYTGGDYIGCCFDADNYKVYFHKNGTWQNSADPSAGTGGVSVSDGEWLFYIAANNSGQGWIANFGQDSTFAGTTTAGGNADENGYGDFKYTVESGFLSLNSANLATELSPTIDDGSEYFHTQLYTGNGVDDTAITNDAYSGDFQPDFLWIKERSSTSAHRIFDSSRGASIRLEPNETLAEATDTSNMKSFDTDGFTLGTSGSTNENGQTYVAWQLKANAGSTSSNTDGDITSTVQANTTAGFSIVTFTGDGNTSTVGHGLGTTPKFYIIKNRSNTGNWWTYTTVIDGSLDFFLLEGTNTKSDSGLSLPTTSVFSVNSTVAPNTNNIVAYCFTNIEGYSKFGSYTGNGSTDGPFVYTGFKPAFVIIKRTDTTNNWLMYDNKRDPDNLVGGILFPNLSDAESIETTNNILDFTSNGFKLRSSSVATNASGGTYIYMAFAENPFVSSSAIPVVAR